MFLSPERLNELLARFPALKAGIIGDVALDAYWYADMTRAHLSRETPHYPRPVVRAAYGPGAGANTAQNLKALGVGEVNLFSVVGKDPWASQLAMELASRGIRTDGWVESAERWTTTYIKPVLMGYHSEQEDARLDFENTTALSEGEEDRVLERLEEALPGLDAILVVDQLEVNGVVTGRIRSRLNDLAAHHPEKIFLVDSRIQIGEFRGMVLKPNQVEAAAGLGLKQSEPQELRAIGRRLSQACGRTTFITVGDQGVWVCEPDWQEQIPAVPAAPPFDIVGAGDTFMAAVAAALAAGASPVEAGTLANLAAAVTVEKLNQTGTATPDEIRRRYQMAANLQ